MFKRIFLLGANYQLVLISVLFLAEIILLNLPLTNHLSYEYAFANSLILFVIGGFLFVYKIKNSGKKYFEVLMGEKLLFITIPLLPLLLGFISTILFSECPFSHGMLFYLVVSIPAFYFGTVFGLLSYYFWERHPIILFIIFFLSICFHTLVEFYFLPIVYFYNVIVGYFPGTIYDEFVMVSNKLVSYRLFNLVFVLSIILFIKLYPSSKRNKINLAAILIFLQIIFMLSKPNLGFTTSRDVLTDKLSTKIVTKHFEIYTSKNLVEAEKKYVGMLHEYYYESLLNEIKFKRRDVIRSYIYKDIYEKEKLFGSRNANVAKPWLRETYVSFETLESSLRHELVHIILSEFGNPIFGVTSDLNPAVIEGYAMAFDESDDITSIHQLSFLAKKSGYNQKLTELFESFNFFGTYSGISYITAGSFIKFLVEKYGTERVIAGYRSGDFDRKIGISISELEKKYYAFLDSSRFEINKSKAQLYFGGNTIFKKFCVRSAASDIQQGWNLFNQKDYNNAFLMFNRVYKYSGSSNSLQGMISSLIKIKDYQRAKNILEKELPKFLNHQSYFRLKLIYSDLLIMNDNWDKAVVFYNELLEANVHIQFNVALERRLSLLKISNSELKNYFELTDEEKESYLSTMINKESNPIHILELLESSTGNNHSTDYYDILLKINISDINTAFTFMKASEYYLKKGEYLKAQKLAVRSFELNDENMEPYFRENLKKVNWFVNNSEEVNIKYDD
ncbi:MAG: hypothetical protein KF816_09670 [Melioribacteraceae bacterium]|nr:hypothetical protein [Melioribacteraceae bacterium]